MYSVEWRYYEGNSLSAVMTSVPADDNTAAVKIKLATTTPGRIAAVIRDETHFPKLYSIFERAFRKDSLIANFQAVNRWKTIVIWFDASIKEIAVAQAVLNKYNS